MLAIRIDRLTKVYHPGLGHRPVTAVDDVSLEVPSGEAFAFLGLNGAGKTTTIKTLLDHARPTSGRVLLFELAAENPEARRRIGYMPDVPHFHQFLSAGEVLAYAARLFGLSRGERDRRIRDLLELVGLGDKGDKKLRAFSRGMLQRVGLAQALINDPDLLILDEPLGGLDPIGRYDFQRIILRQRERGKTIFFSSHILEDAEKVADRAAIIHKGKLIAAGSIEKLLAVRQGWEIEVSGLQGFDSAAEAASRGWICSDEADRLLLHIDDEVGMSHLHSLAAQEKLRILSLNPRRRTLEAAFLAELDQWKH